MQTQWTKLSKTGGWVAIFLGIIHLCYTYILTGALKNLDPGFKGIFLYMYIAAGLACVLAGVMIMLSTEKSIRKMIISNHICLISSIFILLLGIGAPVAMKDNPFGYISLATGAFMTTVALHRYRYHSEKDNTHED